MSEYSSNTFSFQPETGIFLSISIIALLIIVLWVAQNRANSPRLLRRKNVLTKSELAALPTRIFHAPRNSRPNLYIDEPMPCLSNPIPIHEPCLMSRVEVTASHTDIPSLVSSSTMVETTPSTLKPPSPALVDPSHSPTTRNNEKTFATSPSTLLEVSPSLHSDCGGGFSETPGVCAICLEEYQEGETLREMPCSHFFHQECVDTWLSKKSDECPLCKASCHPCPSDLHDLEAKESPRQPTNENEFRVMIPRESPSRL